MVAAELFGWTGWDWGGVWGCTLRCCSVSGSDRLLRQPSGLSSDRTAEYSQGRSCLTSAECSPFTSDPPSLHFNLTRSPNSSPSPITRSFKVARQQPLIRAAHRLCLFCGFIQMWPARRSRGRSKYISIGGTHCAPSSVWRRPQVERTRTSIRWI